MALVSEAARQGDLGKRQLPVAQAFLGEFDSSAQQPAVRRCAGGASKGPREMAERKTAYRSERRQSDLAVKVRLHKVLDAPFLPWGKTTPCGAFVYLHASERVS